ncbi:MAG: ATP-binding protein, partial [Desulfobacula sp.]|nr:ATP-binding protein [Desulfobacula sp.]
MLTFKPGSMELSYIYNPANQTPDELIENFVIRKKEFTNIMDDIRRDKMKNPPQHYIIQGQRGTGKTTLLLRMYHEIKRDKGLNKWMVPILFSEEQYNIRTLFKLWEELAFHLEKEDSGFFGLVNRIEKLDYSDHEEYEEQLFELICDQIQKSKKKITILIDNIGLLFNRFNRREQQRLREVLLTGNKLRIIGASAYVLKSIQNYVKPFYEFFKVINLQPLNAKETKTLLLTLDEKYESGTIPNIIKKQPGRIEALRRISGGIPRTLILLFEIFSDNESGNSVKDLEIILDKVTPLYKHRMDDLPAQQQEIAHIIAM